MIKCKKKQDFSERLVEVCVHTASHEEQGCLWECPKCGSSAWKTTALCWSGILQLPMLVRDHPVAYELEAPISPRLLCPENSFLLPPCSPIRWKALNFEDLSLSLPLLPLTLEENSIALELAALFLFHTHSSKSLRETPLSLCLCVCVNSDILLQQIFSQLCNKVLADIRQLQIIKPTSSSSSVNFISLQNHQTHKLLFFCEFISLQIIKPTSPSSCLNS